MIGGSSCDDIRGDPRSKGFGGETEAEYGHTQATTAGHDGEIAGKGCPSKLWLKWVRRNG